MKLSQFKFNISENLLATHPPTNRDESRLMVIDRKTGKIEHKVFKDIISYFGEDDVMVLNNTKADECPRPTTFPTIPPKAPSTILRCSPKRGFRILGVSTWGSSDTARSPVSSSSLTRRTFWSGVTINRPWTFRPSII